MILTMAVNVPMTEALARIIVPDDIEAARAIWVNYSPDWQFWNQMRTIATGAAVLCIGLGITRLNPA
ncbi:MAG: anthrone oxygenase family protein [Sulfitobacter geojensis]